MSTTTTTAGTFDAPHDGFWSSLTTRQLRSYPSSGIRYGLLAVVVLITTALYYELYVGSSVATLQLTSLHMSFGFYVVILAVGNLIGAFGSLLAGLADRIGRCNLVVGGLLLTGVLVAFVLPEATTKWAFGIEYFAVGLVEGICLVATPALIRDFSPQVGRGSAMAFWTMGPVLGSLVVSVVGSSTITASTAWPHEYRICGVVGLAVFVVAFFLIRELSPALRDQLMVTTRDRVLVEARAKGLDIEATLRHPFRQLLKPEIIISAIGVSVLLASYYTAVAFGTIFYTTTFGFSLNQANHIGNWNWGINVAALLIAGVLSDRIRVRKPFMLVGGVWAAIATVLFLLAPGHHYGYSHMVILTVLVSFGVGLAYVTWMASFTESVEARNPALTATGLAIWGWILRVVVFGLFLVLPLVVNAVNPLVNYGTRVQTLATTYKTQLAFATTHPKLVAFAQSHGSLIAFAQTHASLLAFAQSPSGAAAIADAQKYAPQIAAAQRFAPELAVIEANPALFTRLLADPTNATLQAQAVAAGGGGAKGTAILTTIATNQKAITGVIAVAPQLKVVQANATELKAVAANAGNLKAVAANATELKEVAANAGPLTALGKVPAADLAYLTAHGAAVTKASSQGPHQWEHWYWVCFAGVIVFLGCIPLLKGRWSPAKAKADEDAHEAMVAAEIAKLNA